LKTRLNPNNLCLYLFFKSLTNTLKILNYYLDSFLDCNCKVKPFTLAPFPRGLWLIHRNGLSHLGPSRMHPFSFMRYFNPVHIMLWSSLKLHLAMSFLLRLSLKLHLELIFFLHLVYPFTLLSFQDYPVSLANFDDVLWHFYLSSFFVEHPYGYQILPYLRTYRTVFRPCTIPFCM